MRKIRADRRTPSDDVLRELLVTHGLTYWQIAQMYGVSVQAVGKAKIALWRRRFSHKRAA
jgi:transposase